MVLHSTIQSHYSDTFILLHQIVWELFNNGGKLVSKHIPILYTKKHTRKKIEKKKFLAGGLSSNLNIYNLTIHHTLTAWSTYLLRAYRLPMTIGRNWQIDYLSVTLFCHGLGTCTYHICTPNLLQYKVKHGLILPFILPFFTTRMYQVMANYTKNITICLPKDFLMPLVSTYVNSYSI